jgi:hypothetical protein
MAETGFALVLNLHQPAFNLDDLLDHAEWEAREILWAMDRIPRSLWGYEDVGRVHLSLSGTLLEPLSSPGSSSVSTASSTAGRCCGTCRTPRSSASSAPGTTIPSCP